MDSEVNSTGIVTAAGSGLRLPGDIKKQYRNLGGIPILIRSLEPFMSSPLISNVIVTVPEDDLDYCQALIKIYFLDIDKPYLVIAGGGERQDSVFGALQNCPGNTDFVFIHDGVRPFISQELLEELLETAQQEGAAIPAAALKHTIKSIDGNYVQSTLPRNELVQVFTPQVFAYKLIMDAYLQAYSDGFLGTDDSSLLERLGFKVPYLISSELNLKITNDIDLFFATQLIDKNMI